MNLEALFNAVIVKPVEQNEEMYGSIVVPDVGKDRNEHGIVVAVGPGSYTHMGSFVDTTVKVGDQVVLPTQGFTKLEHEGEEFYVGPENQILARVRSTIDDILGETKVTPEEEKAINELNIEENE